MSTIPDSNSNSAMAPRGSLRAACFAAVTVFMKFLSLAQRKEMCAGPFARRCKFRANNAEGANRAMRNQESNTSKSHSWTRHGRASMQEKLRLPGYIYLPLIYFKLTGWFITIGSRPSVACLPWPLSTIGERPSRVGAAVPNEAFMQFTAPYLLSERQGVERIICAHTLDINANHFSVYRRRVN